MKILVTGAKGFVGKNLCLALEHIPDTELFRFDIDETREQLEQWLGECDFVMHLAGVNRPKDPAEFKTGNTVFTEDMLELLAGTGRKVPVLLSSSIQAALDNDYGKSKKAAEEAVFEYGRKTGAPVFVFRLANVFGKWCRPNYNSAVATWCHNIARDLPIMVRDPAAEVSLVYIDDVVKAFIGCIGGTGSGDVLSVAPSYRKTLGEITEMLNGFHSEPHTLDVPDQRDGFSKKLYATYLSYLPERDFAYPLTMHEDARGSFTEALHSDERGQVSVNVSRPGITKGQHWHHTKHEKFLVVSGKGVIRFRPLVDPDAYGCQPGDENGTASVKVNRNGAGRKVIEYFVSGDKLEVVRIPPGYTHNIENLGDTDMVTLMWANEVFDPSNADTFREEV